MILRNMTEHSSRLVQQAILVSEELIRVAILWHEQWHEGLEDASRSLSLYLCYSGLYLRICWCTLPTLWVGSIWKLSCIVDVHYLEMSCSILVGSI